MQSPNGGGRDSSLERKYAYLEGHNETTKHDKVFSDEIMAIIDPIFILGLNPIASICAVVCSLTNVVGFARMRLRDGVTQNFLVLSISDTLVAVLTSLLSVSLFLMYYNVAHYLPGDYAFLASFQFFVKVVINMPVVVSMLITTVIAVVRCTCVAMPLTVRQIITTKKQLATICVLSCVVIFVCAYSFKDANLSKPACFKHGLNKTSGFGKRTREGSTVKKFWIWDTFMNSIFYSCLCITLMSIIILTVSLKRATRFRNLVSTASTGSPSISSSAREMARREAKIVKSVILVLIIFVVCNLPTIVLSSVRLTKKKSITCSEHRFMLSLSYVLLDINVSCNIFVYYKFISRFRQKIDSMICKGSHTDGAS